MYAHTVGSRRDQARLVALLAQPADNLLAHVPHAATVADDEEQQKAGVNPRSTGVPLLLLPSSQAHTDFGPSLAQPTAAHSRVIEFVCLSFIVIYGISRYKRK